MDNSLAKNSVSMKFDAQPMEEVEIPEIGVMEMSEKPEIQLDHIQMEPIQSQKGPLPLKYQKIKEYDTTLKPSLNLKDGQFNYEHCCAFEHEENFVKK